MSLGQSADYIGYPSNIPHEERRLVARIGPNDAANFITIVESGESKDIILSFLADSARVLRALLSKVGRVLTRSTMPMSRPMLCRRCKAG